MRFFFSIIILFAFLTSCNEGKPKTVQTVEISFSKHGELKLLKKDTDSIIAVLDIEIADNEYTTQTGLMYRSSMEQQQAMLFIFPEASPKSFYMKNTQIALDIIFFNEHKEIISFHKNAKPYSESSLLSNGNAMYVLEVNAGLSDQWQLEVGDRISWETVSSAQ